MTYPGTPDFTIASDDAVWWLVGYTGADGNPTHAVCSTGGRAFVDILQVLLGLQPADGRWGPETSAALVTSARNSGGSQALIAGIQQDAANRQITVNSLRAAAFFLHGAQAFGGNTPIGIPENQIAFDPATIPPQWDVAAPMGPSGDIVPSCMAAGGGTSPQAGSPPAQPSDQTPSTGDMTGGSLLAPSPPNYPAVIQPTQPSTAPLVLLGAVAVGAAGWFAWNAYKKAPAKPKLEARANPDRSERHERRSIWTRSHTNRLTGRAASSELSRVRSDYDLSDAQSHAAEQAIHEGFQLTSRASGSGAAWHLRLCAPSGGGSKITTRRLERHGFREVPTGEFNAVIGRRR